MRPTLFTLAPWVVYVLTAAFTGVLVFLERKQSTRHNLLTIGMGIAAIVIEIVFLPEKIEIPAYGFMIMIAFISGTYLAAWRARRWGINPDHVIDLGLFALISGILGARILFTIQYFDVYFWGEGLTPDGQTFNKVWNIFKVWQGGLVFYGGLIGGTTVLVLVLRKRKLSVAFMSDLCLPSVILGLAITRLGCFFNGCCFGKICKLPWTVKFPIWAHAADHQLEQLRDFITAHSHLLDPLAYGSKMQVLDILIEKGSIHTPQARQILEGLRMQVLEAGAPVEDLSYHLHTIVNTTAIRDLSLPVHPSQLYAAISAFLIFLLLLGLTRRRRFDGQIGTLFVIFYSINRFLLETTRMDNARNLGLTISQWISIAMCTSGIALHIYLMKRKIFTPLPIDPSRPEARPVKKVRAEGEG